MIGKPLNIEKMQVYEAYLAVKSNGGGAGVDGQTLEQFGADLKSNLYKIWCCGRTNIDHPCRLRIDQCL